MSSKGVRHSASRASMTPARFRALVLKHYRVQGRHALPWRKTRDPYKILVSEVMLQQTQVDRVIPFYTAWLKKYPNVEALAHASLADVLASWQGLGYNRRAKLLWEAAKAVVREHGGRMPRSAAGLLALPGVGPYTAGAVAAFAYGHDAVLIETNLRTAVIHHFFPEETAVADRAVLEVLARVLPKGSARQWYWALMDYGAHLKRSGVRNNSRSTAYVKQKSFKGSTREIRGALLRALIAKPATALALEKLFPKERAAQIQEQLDALVREGLVEKRGRTYRLPS